jgi:predicted AAA+ superfamily ATPase
LTEEKIILAKDNDEEVISFVDVVLGLSREPNIDLYVTGSNSKMLSSDIITEFRDKATEIHMCPLSFEEFYNYVGGSKVDAFDEYMMHAPGFTDWSFKRFYNSWGFGVRVRRPDMYWFRVQLGFHGLHGVNLVLTIAPEFR